MKLNNVAVLGGLILVSYCALANAVFPTHPLVRRGEAVIEPGSPFSAPVKYPTSIYAFEAVKLDLNNSDELLDPKVFRGGFLRNESEYKYLKTNNINTIINLEMLNKTVAVFCRELGIDCQDLPVRPFNTTDLNTDANFIRAFKVAVSKLDAGEKIYMHCLKGKDRTGMLIAALAIRKNACGKDLAPLQKRILHDSILKDLNTHRFYGWMFPEWFEALTLWIAYPETANDWLCKNND